MGLAKLAGVDHDIGLNGQAFVAVLDLQKGGTTIHAVMAAH